MGDIYSPEARHRMMSAVRARDTRPELLLRRALWSIGLRGWRCHRNTLPGRPDLSFGRFRIAVFVDGAFWHGHPDRFTPGKSGPYWDAKIRRNVERDRENDRDLVELGWTVLRFWDFEVRRDPDGCARRVAEVLSRRSRDAA